MLATQEHRLIEDVLAVREHDAVAVVVVGATEAGQNLGRALSLHLAYDAPKGGGWARDQHCDQGRR